MGLSRIRCGRLPLLVCCLVAAACGRTGFLDDPDSGVLAADAERLPPPPPPDDLTLSLPTRDLAVGCGDGGACRDGLMCIAGFCEPACPMGTRLCEHACVDVS